MKELISRTDNVINKTRRLIKHQHAAEERLITLEKEIKELKQSLEAERNKTAELNNQIKIIKLARNIGSGRDFRRLEDFRPKKEIE